LGTGGGLAGQLQRPIVRVLGGLVVPPRAGAVVQPKPPQHRRAGNLTETHVQVNARYWWQGFVQTPGREDLDAAVCSRQRQR
jgi:hypothetical protein